MPMLIALPFAHVVPFRLRPKSIPSPRISKLSDVARQVLATAMEQGVEAVVVGIPVQPGGSIVKPHTDSGVVSSAFHLFELC